MKKYFHILRLVKLFNGIGDAELEPMLNCLRAETRTVRKDEIVLMAGEKPEYVGIAMSGQLHIAREDLNGNRSIVASVGKGDIFAEALCCAGVAESPVTVSAMTDADVLLLRFDRILNSCPHSCGFHQKLIENMLRLIARKNLHLQSRMEILSLKSIRMKILRYLEGQAPKGGNVITIPFNREEMADFLCVERSALSHELSRMKRDGLIDYKKNTFILQ